MHSLDSASALPILGSQHFAMCVSCPLDWLCKLRCMGASVAEDPIPSCMWLTDWYQGEGVVPSSARSALELESLGLDETHYVRKVQRAMCRHCARTCTMLWHGARRATHIGGADALNIPDGQSWLTKWCKDSMPFWLPSWWRPQYLYCWGARYFSNQLTASSFSVDSIHCTSNRKFVLFHCWREPQCIRQFFQGNELGSNFDTFKNHISDFR